MANIIEAKSTLLSVLTRSIWSLVGKTSNEVLDTLDSGKPVSTKSPVGFWNILTPFHIKADIDNKRITVSKRNWYLISKQEDVYAFKSVRHVVVKNHVFGADIGIRMFAGTAVAYSISKSKAKEIREVLLNADWNRNDADVVIGIDS